MADNLYLELELFLDNPSLTDATALEVHLNEQIKQWHKQVNANPKLKLRVSKAKEFMNAGLRNLPQLAKEARAQKLDELRKKIELYKKTGVITPKNLKQLENQFKNYFTLETIKNEVGDVGSASTVQSSMFNAPPQPESLKTEKMVSFADMKNIAEWLAHVKGGKCQNLYQLLELPQNISTATLHSKAEEQANIINKMPKSGIEADFLNKLAQKFLLYFKNDAERKSYDGALKREPFDKLCDEELSLYAENFVELQKTDWQLYLDTIQQTQQLGFTQQEAVWLVYDFFCNKRKCPEPVPTTEKEMVGGGKKEEGIGTNNLGVGQKLSGWWSQVKDAACKVGEAVKNFKPPEQTVIQKYESYGTETVKTTTVIDRPVPPLPFESNKVRAEQEAKERAEREAREAMAKAEQLERELKELNARAERERAERQAKEAKTKAEQVEQGLQEAKARAEREKAEQEVKEAKARAEQAERELQEAKAKAEREEKDRAAANREFPYKTKQIQELIDAKRYHEVYQMLLPYKYELPDKYTQLWTDMNTRINQCEKQCQKIQETILQSNSEQAERQIAQLQQYVPDYPDIETLRNKLQQHRQKHQYGVTEINILSESRRFLDADSRLRIFLADNPNCKDYSLLTFIPHIESQIQQQADKRRANVWLALITGVFGGGLLTIPQFVPKFVEGTGEQIESLRLFFNIAGYSCLGICGLFILIFVLNFIKTFPARCRHFFTRIRLYNSEFGKAKLLSKTVWYAMLNKEWQQKQQQSQSLPKSSQGTSGPPKQPTVQQKTPRPQSPPSVRPQIQPQSPQPISVPKSPTHPTGNVRPVPVPKPPTGTSEQSKTPTQKVPIPRARLFIVLMLLPLLIGCGQSAIQTESVGEKPVVSATKKDDSTSCAYWKCSTTKKLYMQKYVKDSGGNYRPAGAYKLDKGEGAFSLSDLDKYGSDEAKVSWSVGINQCPYCPNESVGQCGCKKIFCTHGQHGTCPWCGRECHFEQGNVNVGGGG